MQEKFNELLRLIGNTPLKKLESETTQLHAKLEYNNLSGSAKDRAALSMLYHGFKEGKITPDTTVVASSSGNLAIAAATICKLLKIKFVPVIDPNINQDYETLLNLMSSRVVKVKEPDISGGYLLTRINVVSQICADLRDAFCLDQYCDPNNYKGYYSLAKEITENLSNIDYLFIAVSSSGAITGISKMMKISSPETKIIAVDIDGSVIFQNHPKKRNISGLGSSQIPPLIKDASIDEAIIVTQENIVNGCRSLLDEQAIFAGASSGAVYYAAKNYLKSKNSKIDPTAVLIFPDKGYAYLDTIYNESWRTGQ